MIRTITLLMLCLLAVLLMVSPLVVGELSAQEVDDDRDDLDDDDDDGFDLGWLGLLGLLGLLPRKPVEERVDHTTHVPPTR